MGFGLWRWFGHPHGQTLQFFFEGLAIVGDQTTPKGHGGGRE
jgi:hypothetical protein